MKLTESRPGDQHRENAATTNPFIDQKPHIAEYTAQEIATLQSRLERQLGPEYISTRPGAGGGKVHYLAAEKVINLANEVFGFNGWSSAIQNVQIDFVDENAENGKITLGLSTIVRVTLRDGTYHEDIGYGHIENCKGKAAAFEKAKKEAATDAMKRALRNFGNVLGNCLYDKDYLQKITKVKVAPARWDAENLHRHPDYAPVKREAIADVAPQQDKDKSSASKRQSSVQSVASYGSMEFEDDFGGNPFDDTDFTHPDEVRLDQSVSAAEQSTVHTPANGGQQPRQGVPRMQSMPSVRPPNVQPPPTVQNPQPPQRPPGPPRPPSNVAQVQANRPLPPQTAAPQQRAGQNGMSPMQPQPEALGQRSNSAITTATESTSNYANQQRQPTAAPQNQADGERQDDQVFPVPRMPPPGIPEGFVTGRSVDALNQPPGARPPNAAIAFNPHAETPSIRRTQGVNPGKSAPVMRQAVTGTSTTNGQQQPPLALPNGPPRQQQGQSNGLNGATASVNTNFVNPSADMNRRIGMPPQAAANAVQNRNAYKPPTPMKRPPLSDVSNIQQIDGGGDAKKVKLDHPAESNGDAPEAVAAPAAT